MTIARILTPHRDADGRWHVPAEISLPYDASIHLIVSAPEHAISAALQMATERVNQAINLGGAVAAGYPPPRLAYPPFGRRSAFDTVAGYDEVAGWWSDLGQKIGKAISSKAGKKVINGVVSYIPYVGPAIAQSGLVDMAADAGGKALSRTGSKKKQGRAGAGRGSFKRGRAPKPRRMSRQEALDKIKRNGGLKFRFGPAVRKKIFSNRKVTRQVRSSTQRLRQLLQQEHGSTGARHMLRLIKAAQLLDRASRGDRAAMGIIDATTNRATGGDTRAQVATGYIGALVRSGDPLAAILKDLGSRRAGYRPNLPF